MSPVQFPSTNLWTTATWTRPWPTARTSHHLEVMCPSCPDELFDQLPPRHYAEGEHSTPMNNLNEQRPIERLGSPESIRPASGRKVFLIRRRWIRPNIACADPGSPTGRRA